MKSERYAVDSSVLLCLVHKEQGWQRVQNLFYQFSYPHVTALLNMINWGEVYYIRRRKVGQQKAKEGMEILATLPLEIVPVDMELVAMAAEIKSDHPISYADAFCVATAIKYNASIVTKDHDFKSVEKLVKINWI